MRKFTWIYILLFLAILLSAFLFFRGGRPTTPETEAPEEENASGLWQEEKDAITILICDPSSSRGVEFMVLDIPETGHVNALLISGEISVGGNTLSTVMMEGPGAVKDALSSYLDITYYLAMDMSLLDGFLGNVVVEDWDEAASGEFFFGMLSEVRETVGALQGVVGTLDTNMPPWAALRIANRLNGLSQEDIQVSVIGSYGELEAGLRQFQEGR